ncbi:hypothetical protein Q8A67_020379 [Cirrhinus molitorella]|uniref:Uncharacterized protein n=1 Tax=Cirrhinus molitorella TaxID=172907 RepID=A0AA88PBR2_9TELE|nr:hypothetical protein Q8A67_020379 [Cirrhinus molitorella]
MLTSNKDSSIYHSNNSYIDFTDDDNASSVALMTRAPPVLREHWLSLCVKGGIRSPLAPGETLLRRPNPPKQAEKLVNAAAVADTQTLAISERSLSLSLSLSVPGLVAVIRALWKPL